MAGNSTKDIKRHQKSIGNTQKITKAMEMVSAVKMRKSQLRAISSRPYAQNALRILQEIALINKEEDLQELKKNPLFNTKESGSTILVVIAPDKGLVGGLNSSLLNYTKKIIESEQYKNKVIHGVSIGEKSKNILEKLNIDIIQEFKMQNLTTQDEIQELINFITEIYQSQKTQKVNAIYTEFFSTIKQSPNQKQIFPITIEYSFRDCGVTVSNCCIHGFLLWCSATSENSCCSRMTYKYTILLIKKCQ